MTLLDTHAHIHDKAFDDDRDAVLERMRAAGVASAVTVGCDLEDSKRALEAAADYGVFCSVGIHPHEAKDAPHDIADAFEPFLAHDRVIAIGETGLDYYYDHSPREAQQRVLRAQIALARDRDFPVIFHHRDAFDDFAAILRDQWRAGMRGIIHCFTGDTAQAQTYVREFGMLLGIGGVLTFKSAQAVRDAVKAVGLAHLVLETDCPYLAPVPHRGERNEPAYVSVTARALADLLGTTAENVASSTTENARTVFGKTLGG
ncbi:MAG TPA: TatD family hydrolase [Candidatus Baltobacteraceae bacterium]|nr:TatD family hydrolase [Candidatus Baltobacteraceae bacterium]